MPLKAEPVQPALNLATLYARTCGCACTSPPQLSRLIAFLFVFAWQIGGPIEFTVAAIGHWGGAASAGWRGAGMGLGLCPLLRKPSSTLRFLSYFKAVVVFPCRRFYSTIRHTIHVDLFVLDILWLFRTRKTRKCVKRWKQWNGCLLKICHKCYIS